MRKPRRRTRAGKFGQLRFDGKVDDLRRVRSNPVPSPEPAPKKASPKGPSKRPSKRSTFTVDAALFGQALDLVKPLALEAVAKTPIRLQVKSGTLKVSAQHENSNLTADLPCEGDDLDLFVSTDIVADAKKLAKKLKAPSMTVQARTTDKLTLKAGTTSIRTDADWDFASDITRQETKHPTPSPSRVWKPIRGTSKNRFDADRSQFHTLLSTLHPYISSDIYRGSIHRALLEFDDAQLRLVATDGHRLATGEFAAPCKAEKGAFTLSSGQVAALVSIARAKDARVQIAHEGEFVVTCTVRMGALTLTASSATDTGFPPWRRLLPTKPPWSEFEVDQAQARGLVQTICGIQGAISPGSKQGVDVKEAVAIGPTKDWRLGIRTTGAVQAGVILPATATVQSVQDTIHVYRKYLSTAFGPFKDGTSRLALFDVLDPVLLSGNINKVDFTVILMPMRAPGKMDAGHPIQVPSVQPPVADSIGRTPLLDMVDLGYATMAGAPDIGAPSDVFRAFLLESDGRGLSLTACNVRGGTDAIFETTTTVPMKAQPFRALVVGADLRNVVRAFPKGSKFYVVPDGDKVRLIDSATLISVPFPPAVLFDDPVRKFAEVRPPACPRSVGRIPGAPFRDMVKASLPFMAYDHRPNLHVGFLQFKPETCRVSTTDGHSLATMVAGADVRTGVEIVLHADVMELLPKLSEGFVGTRDLELHWTGLRKHENPGLKDPPQGLKFSTMGSDGIVRSLTSTEVGTKFPAYDQIFRDKAASMVEVQPEAMRSAVSKVTAMKATNAKLSGADADTLLIESTAFRTKVKVPMTTEGAEPLGEFHGAFLSNILAPLAGDSMAIYLGPENDPGVVQGKVSPFVDFTGLVMPIRQKDGEEFYPDDTPTPVRIPTWDTFPAMAPWAAGSKRKAPKRATRKPKATVKKPSGRKPSPRKATPKPSAPPVNRFGLMLANALDSVYRGPIPDIGKVDAVEEIASLVGMSTRELLDGLPASHSLATVVLNKVAARAPSGYDLLRVATGKNSDEWMTKRAAMSKALKKPSARKPSPKKPSARKPSPKKPSARKPSPKKPSERSLNILDAGAFEKLAAIEGEIWERRQRKGGVKLANSFALNKAAYEVILAEGLGGLDIPLADLDSDAGVIAGFAGAAYIVMPDGEVMLDGQSTSPSKRARAAKAMQVI
jgi:DNA polymerase III sliding clamp (beta) subunit (PCNA family)